MNNLAFTSVAWGLVLASCSNVLEVHCVGRFDIVSIVAVDTVGDPVTGMNVTVSSLVVGDTLQFSYPEPDPGDYVVMDDSYLDRIIDGEDLFRATGRLDDAGFLALFRFGTDENACRPLKLAGPDTVIVQ